MQLESAAAQQSGGNAADPSKVRRAIAAAARNAKHPPFRFRQWPIALGKIISEFERPRKGDPGRPGITFSATQGQEVRAVAVGTVNYVGDDPKTGHTLRLLHVGGYSTTYGLLGEISVNSGETVNEGQIIAHVGPGTGRTGAQFYFELRQGRVAVDPYFYLLYPLGDIVRPPSPD